MNPCELHGDVLLRSAAGANRVLIVAPYIKVNVLERVLGVISPDASVICVTKWTPHDLASGVSDIQCRDAVIRHGGSFNLHSSLHAKYYRFDDIVLVGSANLSSAAMGWARFPNVEILCAPAVDFGAAAFERWVLQNARQISDHEFLLWGSILKTAASDYEPAIAQPFSIDDWRPSTRDPHHLEVAYHGSADQIASFDEQRAILRDMQTMRIPENMTIEELRVWASACLLSSPFVTDVMTLRAGHEDESSAALAERYGLSIAEARRSRQTVMNWLIYLGL